MAKYNFDEIIDRKGTNAIKVDALKERYGDAGLIPLWVADMDFRSAQEIIDAIVERAKHGVFGYTSASQEYYNSIANWVGKYHNWKIEQEWISFVPGVVKGIAFVVDAFSQKGDNIIIQPPVYHPFRIVPTLHERTIIDNSLVLISGRYYMNVEGLKRLITPACKILILCNPHNPAGRVWHKQELSDIAEICYDNNILVIADEIHADLTFEKQGHKHIPFASVSEKAAQNSITFMAPSKTFNIAGVVSSFAVVPNEGMRKKFFAYLERSELADGHIFAYLATQVAYEKGEEWLEQVKDYVWDNITFVDEYLKNNIPQIKVMIPDASYLVWLDCRGLQLSQPELEKLFIKEAKLALNTGTMFGVVGEGFMRMNVGTSRKILEKALDNLKKAINR